MSNLGPLLERNRAFAATGAHTGLAIMPRQPVLLVTCLDPRVDPAAFLGVELGDAPVIRNAGGRVTGAVVADIAFIGYVAKMMNPGGPLFEVAVVHHTGCGTGFLADAEFRSTFAADTGLDEAALAAQAVVDPADTVRADVARLLAAPAVLPEVSVSGHVYDLETGLVTTIVPRSQARQAEGRSAGAPGTGAAARTAG
ncbi:MAG TPA: carbonic anhydrase [Streptosporangiaceae bacterium]|jgi:carbonic anhydrase